MGGIRSFRDLVVWQNAHQLVLEVYRLTSKFPSHEMYGLVSQLRRAVVSVPSNIVEGFNRSTLQDSLHFYTMSHASLEEVKYQLLVALDLGYISRPEYDQVNIVAESVSKLLRAWKISQKENVIA